MEASWEGQAAGLWVGKGGGKRVRGALGQGPQGAECLLTQPSANLPLKRQGSGWEGKEENPSGWEAEDIPRAVDALLLKLVTNRDASYSVALGAGTISRPEFVVLISTVK